MIALLANPDSGSGEAGEVERLLRERQMAVSRFGLDRVDEAVASRPDRIVAAGGDGTLGCAADAAARAGVPLGVVPTGTANDFARFLGLPADLADATELAATGQRTETLDLGRFQGAAFVNAASAGLSPIAARQAHGLKGAFGPLAYALGALRAAASASPVAVRVAIDGEVAFDGRAWQVTVALTGAFGGGAEVDADPADGALDVVVIEAGSRMRLMAYGYALRAGNVEDHAGVRRFRGRRVDVEIDAASGFNVDGELRRERRMTFGVEPRAFEVVVG